LHTKVISKESLRIVHGAILESGDLQPRVLEVEGLGYLRLCIVTHIKTETESRLVVLLGLGNHYQVI
jgi:hypothetical protein